MTIRSIAFVATSCVLAMFLSIPAAAQSNGGSARTADGHPDLGGVWDFRTVTPLERPEEFSDKEFFTEEEVAGYAAEQVLARNADLNREEKKEETTERGQVNGTTESIDLALAYNDFWWDRGTVVVETRRTSLVVDPPNGRIPALTDSGAALGRRTRPHQPTTNTGPGGSSARRALHHRLQFRTADAARRLQHERADRPDG